MRALIIAAIVVSAASPVVAAETSPTVQTAISYSDLNLASDAGRKALDQRIRIAARQVCGKPSLQDGLRARLDANRCQAEAISATRAKIAMAAQSQVALR
jgi:UrcA family protein